MQHYNINDMDSNLQSLYRTALAARAHAYIPYSHFAVGAAVRCANGKVYSGCNIENASYGLCVCGERNAMFNAVYNGPLVKTTFKNF